MSLEKENVTVRSLDWKEEYLSNAWSKVLDDPDTRCSKVEGEEPKMRLILVDGKGVNIKKESMSLEKEQETGPSCGHKVDTLELDKEVLCSAPVNPDMYLHTNHIKDTVEGQEPVIDMGSRIYSEEGQEIEKESSMYENMLKEMPTKEELEDRMFGEAEVKGSSYNDILYRINCLTIDEQNEVMTMILSERAAHANHLHKTYFGFLNTI